MASLKIFVKSIHQFNSLECRFDEFFAKVHIVRFNFGFRICSSNFKCREIMHNFFSDSEDEGTTHLTKTIFSFHPLQSIKKWIGPKKDGPKK